MLIILFLFSISFSLETTIPVYLALNLLSRLQ